MRGEYAALICGYPHAGELPPRARRIRFLVLLLRLVLRTTSACAENTHCARLGYCCRGNYLRVRGEYLTIPRPMKIQVGTTSACAENTPSGASPHQSPWELPPRARRILLFLAEPSTSIGTTSACAENTKHITPRRTLCRNYLRARGEYIKPNQECWGLKELPPRTRRIRIIGGLTESLPGTTSAHAENTGCGELSGPILGNYLRARGEYS